jgi:hypothetical protein
VTVLPNLQLMQPFLNPLSSPGFHPVAFVNDHWNARNSAT